MATKLLIDLSSIRPNENYRPCFARHFVPSGYVETLRDDAGTVVGYQREMIDLTSADPGPRFFYNYIPAPVTCRECGETFSSNELVESDTFDDTDYETCPRCGEPACCDIEYEKLTDSELERRVRPC